MHPSRRPSTLAILAGAALLVTACATGSATPSTAPTAAPSRTAAATPTAIPAPASVAPTPAPSSAALPQTLDTAPAAACAATDPGKTCITPGTYQLTRPFAWPAIVTIDVPAGWAEWDADTGWDAVLVNKGRGGSGGASGWGVMFYTVGDVARDPCDSTKGSIAVGEVDTPQKLATAIAAWPNFVATAPKSITVDGHPGLEFQLTSTKKSTCTDSGSAGSTASGADVDAYPMVDDVGAHDTATIEIVDTGHGLLVIRAMDFPQTSPAELGAGVAMDPGRHKGDQADLHAILDSIRITPQASS
jgi:hypothetical protein